MTLSFGLSPWLLAACALVAAGLTYWSYHRTVPAVSPLKRAVLMALRFGALFIVLALLFEPVLRRQDTDTRPPVLAVLVDDSQSLTLAGGADTSRAVPAQAVQALLDGLDGFDADELRLFSFSGTTRALPSADSLGFAGGRTDIAQALDHVRDAMKNDNLRGVLLVSDGRYNTGRNPLYTAERYSVPISTVVLGDTTRQRDVQIRRVTTNDLAYVDVALPVQVGLRADGYGGAEVAVTLARDGQVLHVQRVRLPADAAEVPVDLTYTPTEEGLQRLQVGVTRLDGETTYRNNIEAVTVRVLQSKRRVLLVAAAPGPDVAALRQLLEADPASRISSYVQKGPGAFYEGPFPTVLDTFDVVVLAGYPGRVADPAVTRRLADAARAGKPVLFVLGRQTDLNALRQGLGEVLPVQPDLVRTDYAEAVFVPTPTGLRHPILEQVGAPAVLWRRLPPLLFNTSRWQTSPDARVLATLEVRGVALNDPLLAVRSRGNTRTAALLGAGTWRWKNVPSDLEAAAALWPGLLANTVQWIAAREDDRPVRVAPVRTHFGGDEDVQFGGQVYDESLNPVDRASIQVEVTAPDGRVYPYLMASIGNGRYTLDVGLLPEGTYRYTATARRDEAVLGTDQGAFAVGGLTLEFKETQADAALMRQIAQRSGGAFVPASAAGDLAGQLRAAGTFTPLVIEETRSTELRHLYALLAVVIVLLTVEWFLRKRSGMV